MKPLSPLVRTLGSIAAVGLASAAFSAWMTRRVEAEVPPLGEFHDLDRVRLHVVEKGAGPPVVLIHGLGQVRHLTHSLVDRLASDFHVFAIDRPGAGYSTRRDDEEGRLDMQARTIADFIGRRGIHKPLVVGHSMGGTVALRLALDHPRCVGGLVLLAPRTLRREVPLSLQAMAIRSPFWRRLVAWTLATPLGVLGGPLGIRRAFHPQRPPRDFMKRGGGLLELRPAQFYTTSLDLVVADDELPGMVGRYGELSLPVGVLFGTQDNLLRPDSNVAALSSRVASLEVELMSGVGHMLPLTHPEAVAAFIRRMATRSGPDGVSDSA